MSDRPSIRSRTLLGRDGWPSTVQRYDYMTHRIILRDGTWVEPWEAARNRRALRHKALRRRVKAHLLAQRRKDRHGWTRP